MRAVESAAVTACARPVVNGVTKAVLVMMIRIRRIDNSRKLAASGGAARRARAADCEDERGQQLLVGREPRVF